jgi:hypothetical protein
VESGRPRISAGGGGEDRFVSWMKARRLPLGRPRTRAFYRVTHTHKLIGAPDGNYQLILFKTSFERKGVAAEAIVLTPALRAQRFFAIEFGVKARLGNREIPTAI